MSFSAVDSVLSLIGNTPLVRLNNLDTGKCQLFVKLENQNPTGSIKDRPALAMIEAAERAGQLKPGGLVVEATAGNTGLGLALVAARKGYKLLLVIPDKMSREKIFHVKAMGADVVMTRSDVGKGHPDYFQDMAERLARERGGLYINQFSNPNNPLSHEATTAPEIWAQMDHRVDAVVAGVGSGGTMTGLSRFFAKVAPQAEMVLADPKGSILAEYVKSGRMGQAGSWLVEGIGEDFIPAVTDLARVRTAYTIADDESFATARALLQQEGILAGSSAGTLVAAALRYCREQTQPKRVVTLICDSGSRYLSKMFNDFWMKDQGLVPEQKRGDLRDIITRRHSQREVSVLSRTDTLQRAYLQFKLNDVSQLPVTEGDNIVGLLDESDVLRAVADSPAAWQEKVEAHMSQQLVTVPPSAGIKDLLPIFDSGRVALVVEQGKFLGLITRIDLLQHLRQRALQ